MIGIKVVDLYQFSFLGGGHVNKITIVKRFLDFVGQYVPLDQAILGTFGGEGLEAHLWEEAKIPGEHGWLVECDSLLFAHLKRELPYHCVKSPEELPPRIDSFHVDLNGTLQQSEQVIRLLFRLLRRGHGKCLAITVADKRRNMGLEHFASIRKEVTRLAGLAATKEFMEHLLKAQHALPILSEDERELPTFFEGSDPDKGAKKEFSCAACLLLALLGEQQETNQVLLPVKIERYVYISRYRAHAWRMRTYFLHFQPQVIHDAAYAAQSFLSCWGNSSFFTVQDEIVQTVVAESYNCPSLTPSQEIRMPNTSKLRLVVQAVGGEVQEEYNQLVEAASGAAAAAKFMHEVRMLLNGTPAASEAAPAIVSQSETATEATAPAPVRRRGRPRKQATPVPANNGTKIEIALDLLRAKAEGEDSYKKATAVACRALGIARKRNRLRTIGGMMARTGGGFRRDFVKRAVAAKGQQILGDLANWFTKIDDQTVSVASLKREAGL